MQNIKAQFDKVKCVLKNVLGQEFQMDENVLRPGPKPKFTDMDVVALSLTAECLGLDSETYLFALLSTGYSDDFPNLISRRQFNDRRKGEKLKCILDNLRQVLSEKIDNENDIYIIDSMPLEICKNSRVKRNQMAKNSLDNPPNKGYCAAQKRHYYGYKLHLITSEYGVPQIMKVSKASLHDIHFLKEVGPTFYDCTIVGDMGYINKDLEKSLLETNNVKLEVPSRKNQKTQKVESPRFKKIRKRVETVFSQLCNQFKIQTNHAKHYKGFYVRILSKICGMTLLQYMNQFMNKVIGKIKRTILDWPKAN